MSRLSQLLIVLLISLGFITDAAAGARRGAVRRAVSAKKAPTRARATAAKKKALLVLLENGGVKANLPDADGEPSGVKLPMASCGKLHFALNPGESPSGLIARLRSVIADNAGCLSPRAWRVQQVDFATFTRLNSDLLIEEVAKGLAMAQNTRGLYDSIVVLEDADMTPSRAVSELRRMAPSYVVDVHVLAHGGDEFFVGGKPPRTRNAARFGSGFFDDVKAIGGLELGAVYQMNCVSGTLTDNWQDAGAQVVNGTVAKKNNYMPQQYYHFMRHWLAGAEFGYAIGESFKESRLYSLPAYQVFGHASYVADSRHIVVGASKMTAKPTKDTRYVVEETTKKTVLELAEDLRAQGKTVAEMVSALLAAGHSLSETAQAVVRATSCNTFELVQGLQASGRSLSEVAAAAKSALAGQLDVEQLCQALLQAGRTPTDVANLLRQNFGKNRSQVARLLHDADCNARQVARALKDALGATTQQVADTLKTLSLSTRTIGVALKRELNASHRQVAVALQKAGCDLTQVVKVLRDEFQCTFATIAQDLAAAGCSLNTSARAIWNSGQQSAAKLNSLAQALATAYAQNLAQVLSALGSMGISA